tara:strand:+ start:4348 stop:5082 length:735 start_codon:yes stop_codon:yes gene_type:complete
VSDIKNKLMGLRAELPQGSTVEKRSKADQAKFKRMESSVAYPTSDAETGVTEKPGDLGEIAYPQSDRMDAEEALMRMLGDSEGSQAKGSKIGDGDRVKNDTAVTTTATPKIKHNRSNHAPYVPPKKKGKPKGPKLDSLDDYEGKQKDEYYPVAQKVIPSEARDAFAKDEAAQMSFSQSAAVKGFKDRLDGEQAFQFEGQTLPNGTRIDTIVFSDGSKYYVDPEADEDDLQEGDVIRLEPPEAKR